jgi:hypothetical protein
VTEIETELTALQHITYLLSYREKL